MEQRNKVRYRLSADAVFAWEGAQHTRLQGKGVTRDISLAGVFIFTATCPPVGAEVELDIFLSGRPAMEAKKVCIRTEAKVIRVEHSAGPGGFAAISQDLKLLFGSNGRTELCVSSEEMTREGENQGVPGELNIVMSMVNPGNKRQPSRNFRG